MSGTPGLHPRSGMISLDLPKGTVKPVPGGVDDHHVTVVYLGPDIDDAAFAKACLRARDAAAGMNGALTGSVAGVASFPPSGSSDGKRPAFASVRLPGAKALRSKLEDLSASEHKNWVPHVTLAYIGKGDPLPTAVPLTPVRFTHLSVHRGGDVKRFPLGGGSEHSGSGPAVELSAQTARLAATPSPWGSPSGPGLWGHKGWKLPDYVEQVSKGILKSGRAATESQAIQMALGVLARWARGGGKVSPEVQAAAAKAIADFQALKAAAHSHSNRDGDAVDLSGDLGEAMAASWLELARVAPGGGGGTKTAAPAATKGLPTAAQVNIATGATGPRAKSGGGGKKQQGGGGGSSGSLHPHVAAGSPAGGQFAKKGSGSSSSGSTGKASTAKKAAPKKAAAKAPASKTATPKTAAKAPAKTLAKTPAKAKQPGKAAPPKMAGKPLPKAGSRQQALQQRAGLLKQAAGDRAKAKAINARIASLTTAIHSAVKAAAAQKAAAANKKSATATAATAVKAAATAPAASTTTAAGATKTTTATAAKATATVAQMRATRSTLRARVVTLKAHAAGLEKQAAAIKLSSGEDGGARFLEMAFAEALTERVPPGKAEGGQFHARTSLTRHDTPEEAARAVNAMSEQQRAAVRASTLPPPGFEWARGDRLALAY